MSEEQYTKTFTSFGGADAVTSFDGKVIGELQGVKWTKHLNKLVSPVVEGVITATVFDNDPLLAYEGRTFNILTQYMSKYGERRLEFIREAHLETKSGGISVDDITTEVVYTFKATDVADIPWLDTHEEMLQYVLDNMYGYDMKQKMRVGAYRELLKFGMDIGRYRVFEKEDYVRLYNAEKELEESKVDATQFAEHITKLMMDKGLKF